MLDTKCRLIGAKPHKNNVKSEAVQKPVCSTLMRRAAQRPLCSAAEATVRASLLCAPKGALQDWQNSHPRLQEPECLPSPCDMKSGPGTDGERFSRQMNREYLMILDQ